MKRKIISIVLIAVFSVVAVFAGYKIFQIVSEYDSGASFYKTMEKNINFSPVPSEPGNTQSSSENVKDEEDIFPSINFDALKNTNPDIVAWIIIDGTRVSYPVVQGDDNDYYLRRMFNREKNKVGSVFMDYKNSSDFSDRNTILHGHHMKDGSMFASLDNYKNQSFYDKHKTGLLITPDKNYIIEFFSGYVASVEEDAWEISFDETGFEKWCGRLIKKSLFKSKVTPSASDRVITLSTCSYEFDNARFVLHGILKQK